MKKKFLFISFIRSLQYYDITLQHLSWKYFLWDRGYALTPTMMTPFHPDKMTSNAERKYQKAHTKTRNVIERSFGVLKQRFRCLDFCGGAMKVKILVDAAKSSLQQLSYTTCVSLIIPHCQKLRGLLKVMMIIRKSSIATKHQKWCHSETKTDLWCILIVW